MDRRLCAARLPHRKQASVIDPDMQPAVSYFFERLLSCGSVRRAMLDMNERHNLHFEYGQAIRMARSTTYCGVRRENYNYCPTYISQDEHAQIMAALEHNVRVRSADNARIHIFSGLLVCSCCGRRLAANTVRKKSVTWTAYRCHRAFGDHVCDNRHLVDERKVEAWLLDYLENGLSDYIVSASVADAQPVVVDNTAAIRERQERVKELFINGFIDLQEYKRRSRRAGIENPSAGKATAAQYGKAEKPFGTRRARHLQRSFARRASRVLALNYTGNPREQRRCIRRPDFFIIFRCTFYACDTNATKNTAAALRMLSAGSKMQATASIPWTIWKKSRNRRRHPPAVDKIRPEYEKNANFNSKKPENPS